MITATSGLPVVYPLSTLCPLCGRRAWRLFRKAGTHSGSTIPYRCPKGHISSRELRRDEHIRGKRAFVAKYVGGKTEGTAQQIKLF